MPIVQVEALLRNIFDMLNGLFIRRFARFFKIG
jgi:hypothetical protein